MMNPQAALELSKIIAQPDIFPEARSVFTRALLDYYRELLYREPHPPIPTPWRIP